MINDSKLTNVQNNKIFTLNNIRYDEASAFYIYFFLFAYDPVSVIVQLFPFYKEMKKPQITVHSMNIE